MQNLKILRKSEEKEKKHKIKNLRIIKYLKKKEKKK